MTTTYWLVIGFYWSDSLWSTICDPMASFRKKRRKYDPYCVLVLQYCRKCYPVDVCNPQRRPGFSFSGKALVQLFMSAI